MSKIESMNVWDALLLKPYKQIVFSLNIYYLYIKFRQISIS